MGRSSASITTLDRGPRAPSDLRGALVALARPSLGLALWLSVFGAFLARGQSVLGADADLAVHVAYGRAILDHGAIPLRDPLVYTTLPTEPVVLHEWGAEVLLALATGAFGLAGPLVALAVIAATLPALQYHRSLRGGHPLWVALAYAVVVHLAIGTHLLVRPHVVTWVLAMIAWELVDRWRRQSWPVEHVAAGLGFLGVFWVNLHGGVVLLAPMLAIAAVHRLRRHRRPELARRALGDAGMLAVVVAFACLQNPAGVSLWTHVLAFLAHTPENVAADMRPPSLGDGSLGWFALVVGALWAPLLARFRAVALGHWLLFAAFTVAAAAAMRNLPILGLLCAPVAADHAAAWLRSAPWMQAVVASGDRLAADQAGRSGHLYSALVALVVFAVACVWRPVELGFAGPNVPHGAAAWLAAHPDVARQRGYAGYDASGYLLYDEVVSVYLHSLNANTPWRLMDELRTIERADPGWEELLRSHDVRWVLATTGSPLADAVAGSACWAEQPLGDDRRYRLFLEACGEPASSASTFAH